MTGWSADSSSPAIDIRDVRKCYGRTEALAGVSLRVAPGDVFGYLGPNGAGKTTLIRLLVGLARPTAGELRVFGGPVRSGRGRRAPIGALVEHPAFYPYLSVIENLRLFAAVEDQYANERARTIGDTIERCGLGPVANRPVSTLSTGLRQRLGICLAVLGRPPLVVLDEPTNGLDPSGIIDVRRLIALLASAGTTVFLSSHLLSEVELSCTRVAITTRGKVVAFGTPEEVAGPARTVVRFSTPADAVAARRRLKEADYSVHDAAPADDRAVEVEAYDARRSELLPVLAASGIYPLEVFEERPSLESAYLRHTVDRVGHADD